MFTESFVPSRLKIRIEALALGADTRQKVSWAKGGKVFSLTPDRAFSDIKEFYFRACAYLKDKKHLSARVISFDPHPYFVCHREASALRDAFFPKARLMPVYHHAAHAATFGFAAGAGPGYIGLAFDGTGWGADGRIWGSEFFVYDGRSFSWRAHFDYLALPGSEAAIRQPWRVALGIAYRLDGRKILLKHPPAFLKKIPASEQKFVVEMIEKDVNTAYASSAGRLFDAVSAMLGIAPLAAKEAEAARLLEKEAARCKGPVAAYPFDIDHEKGGLRADFTEMFREILASPLDEASRSRCARRFHWTLACCIARMSRLLSRTYRIKQVYASGGVFMNGILKEDLKQLLASDGLDLVFAPASLMTDEGISAGQIAFLTMDRGAQCV